jgi:crotonobetainyl-CoA:carnitine CoA-transferase CaiB-like acyl-CoA transferase
LGEHNREVLVEAGFSLEEVAALAEQRVIVGS